MWLPASYSVSDVTGSTAGSAAARRTRASPRYELGVELIVIFQFREAAASAAEKSASIVSMELCAQREYFKGNHYITPLSQIFAIRTGNSMSKSRECQCRFVHITIISSIYTYHSFSLLHI